MLWLSRPDSETTWEPASALSPSLVADYEAGLLTQATSETEDTYGHTSTTVVVRAVPSEPARKKMRRKDLSREDELGLVDIELEINMYNL